MVQTEGNQLSAPLGTQLLKQTLFATCNMPETEFLWQIRSQSGDRERGDERLLSAPITRFLLVFMAY